MNIHIFIVGPLETNCYIVEDEKNREAIIIDPGDEPEKILDFLEKHPLKVREIIVTHGHFDHVGAVWQIKEKLKVKVLMHKNDLPLLSLTTSPLPDRLLIEKDRVDLGELSFEVLHLPGHTPGSIGLYCEKEKVLFSGDTLFAGTWGRTDLPYSSEKDMATSLKKLLKLPPETKVYPGHGETTTIGEEQDLLAG
ncbi:MAG: MBL fold metallo-hydrolase [Candidatus Margulisiibacteriota bacterium]